MMFNFLYKIIDTIFLFIVFLVFIILLLTATLSLNWLGITSGFISIFFISIYVAGIFQLIFAFWLVFSEKTVGDWRFGILTFSLFLIFVYYHSLSIYYTLTVVESFKYLLILDELILLYVFMSISIYMSAALKHEYVENEKCYEVFKKRFKMLLTFLLISLFSLYFYESLGVYSKTNLVNAHFSIYNFPYLSLIQALLNSGFLPLCFTLWLIYGGPVNGNIYYYINLFLLLVCIYLLQIFLVDSYFNDHPNDETGYWLLQGIIFVATYLATVISIIFSQQDSLEEEQLETLIEGNEEWSQENQSKHITM